ncbi:glycosyltransferase family 2 protein [Sphaerotilaceae bacterium SBD11-9]
MTTLPPTVSVVVPCFNAAAYISRTLESVLAQTYSAFELIVVDDKSTDQTTEIVERYAWQDARVKLIRMPKNAGAPAAPRNAGVTAASGEWVAFLDADDLWHPRKLELQMRALEAQGAQMCSTQMKDFRDERDIVPQEAPPYPSILRITWRQQLIKYRTPTSSIVVRRELMLLNPFNEDLSYKAREDTDCFIRMHEFMDSSIKIAHPLVYYRQQMNQISGNKWKMVGRHLAMLKKYRCRSGGGLGAMAYVYTLTHFVASIYLRSIRGVL